MNTLSRDGKVLDRIRKIFALSENDLATVLGVQRQSVTGWREHGIPVTRQASVERLNGLVEVLYAELIPSRIPEIVRTPDEWLGGRSILDTIRIDGTEAVYGYLSRLFGYAGT